MKILNSEKGFTLIELLIVIAIIAVLAVAFLPTILNAPAKGRDTARIAALQKIQKVIVSADLEGRTITSGPAGACMTSSFFSNPADIAAIGGTFPTDPKGIPFPTPSCSNSTCGCAQVGGSPGKYLYKPKPSISYKFGLYALMENCSAANTLCSTAETGTVTAPTCTGVGATSPLDLCYAILVK